MKAAELKQRLSFAGLLIRFGGRLGLRCLEVTGDHDHEEKELDSADIVCTTPEKFGKEILMYSKLAELVGALPGDAASSAMNLPPFRHQPCTGLSMLNSLFAGS